MNEPPKGMDRTRTAKGRMGDGLGCEFVPGTPEERVAMVWPLTREVASLSKDLDAESRLQRHITRVIRREG